MADLRQLRLHCLRLILRPVVRFCLRQSLTAQDLIEACKVNFIEVAKEAMSQGGDKINVSRLSVATGLQRREVMRLTSAPGELRASNSIASRVIGQWEHDPRFAGPRKAPRVLSIATEKNEFAELVRLISSDVNPGTVLFELERTGAVERRGNQLKLVRTSFVPRGDVESGFDILARDIEDLTVAVEENIFLHTSKPNLHGRTEFDNIIVADVPAIRRWLLREGTKFHERARQFLSRFDRDIHPTDKVAGARVVIGTFSRITETEVAKK